MSQKPKFKPVITRIKLNPEQAVLQCSCYDTGYTDFSGSDKNVWICDPFTGKQHRWSTNIVSTETASS